MSDLKFPDETWAVFNQHVNEAGKRALAIVAQRYPDAADELVKANKDGIMSIFQTEPTPATQMYATLVYVFANGLDQIAVETK